MRGLWRILQDAAMLMAIMPSLRKAYAYHAPGKKESNPLLLVRGILEHIENAHAVMRAEGEFIDRVRRELELPAHFPVMRVRQEIFEILKLSEGTVLPVGFSDGSRIVASRMGPFSGERRLPEELVLCAYRDHDKEPVEQRYVKAPS